MTAHRISQLKEIIALEEKRTDLQSKIATLEAKIAELQGTLYGGSKSKDRAGKSVAAGTRKGRGALREEILEVLIAAGTKGAGVQEIAGHLGTKAANIHSWFSTNAKKVKGLKKVGEARYALQGAAPAAAIAKPAKVAKPAKAEKATKPAKAEKPAKPAKATKPAKAAKPAKPAKVAKATKPAKAAKPAKATKAAKTEKAPKVEAPKVEAPKASKKSAARRPAKRGELKDQILDILKTAGSEGVTIKDLSDKLNVKYKNLYIWFVTTGKRIEGVQKVSPARYALIS